MILLSNVSKIYPNGSTALDDISFFIERGEFVFIVGPSGSGKSTLIKLLMHEEVATSGQVIINNDDVALLKRREIPYLRRSMGVVFQDFRLLPKKTVFENVAFAMDIIGASRKEIRKQVPNVLSLVGLSHKAKSYPDELSGGEQQRVALARALVNNPAFLIADEPTGNLNPKAAMEIMELLDDINKRGTTVIMATHAKEIVDRMKKRVIAIEDGKIARDETRGGYGNED
ncbi:MAG TPA: cell division ATP-binding protein FtsE [Clostridiales bacterium]|uniref:Cell division ATP-binding protein FtsE n=1 Tax=Congzhengia minquanensis TaxID=2763657 RepID=A0A926DLD3_9FIRM|nr:cell division ATP-binding protein FtsE [Congzhengia minquanensis]MBC8541090.1 cell division ATP-binding protein FtsE [Congzhengia minquanensis]MBD8946986.1 cell division ATP-binding protein FtsE [Clostridiales bacterium]HBL81778.1 cell division ATP-binding protein FtsE [Clostridiales bacterium]